jgi:excisionase family DNA binding protein
MLFGTPFGSLHLSIIEHERHHNDENLIAPPALLKPSDVARLLNVSRSAVYRLLENGELRYLRVGDIRVPTVCVSEFIARGLAAANGGAP